MNTNTSWDGTSMDSIDLLSLSPSNDAEQGHTQHQQQHQMEMEQISEEPNHQLDTEPMSAAAPTASSSSSEQHHSSGRQIYQIDFDVEHLGKNKPQSKRMAIWKYGISYETPNGDKRISGHEAKLVWSTHSGKYTILVDGEEVFSSKAKGSVLEHKWKWNHAKACLADEDGGDAVPMRIIACRKPPVRSSKDFRCYEFVIGGKVFRDLPVNESDKFTQGMFSNEEGAVGDCGKLMSILDVIEPGWRANGFV